MGLKIEKNLQGLYTISSTDTKAVLEECVDENSAKKFFINKRLWEFISDIVKIDGDFPNGFFINGKMTAGDLNGSQFVSYAYQQENTDELLFNKYLEIHNKLSLDFSISADDE